MVLYSSGFRTNFDDLIKVTLNKLIIIIIIIMAITLSMLL